MLWRCPLLQIRLSVNLSVGGDGDGEGRRDTTLLIYESLGVQLGLLSLASLLGEPLYLTQKLAFEKKNEGYYNPTNNPMAW